MSPMSPKQKSLLAYMVREIVYKLKSREKMTKVYRFPLSCSIRDQVNITRAMRKDPRNVRGIHFTPENVTEYEILEYLANQLEREIEGTAVDDTMADRGNDTP